MRGVAVGVPLLWHQPHDAPRWLALGLSPVAMMAGGRLAAFAGVQQLAGVRVHGCRMCSGSGVEEASVDCVMWIAVWQAAGW